MEVEMPRQHDNLYEWVDFFFAVRKERMSADGFDIVIDRETMHAWFCNLFMMGYDKARVERMFQDAGVDNIRDYMDKLMNGDLDEGV